MKGASDLSGSIGTTLLRRHIGRWLTVLRESAGISQDAAAQALQRGSSTIWRIEAGDSRIRFRDVDVDAMCTLYRVSPETRHRLLTMTRETRDAPRRAWWHDYTESALPAWFGLYVSLEDSAAMIRQYESELIPGLLQTREYAEAVNRVLTGYVTEEDIERRVTVRMERQSLLRAPRPPHLRVILNEAVLRREVGGRQVMADQLRHLIDAIRQFSVSIRILPYSAGVHGAMTATFTLLNFPNAPLSPDPVEPPLAYVDTLTGALYLNKADELRAYEMVWNHLDSRALDEESSTQMISDALEALEQ
ncbi:helix-turn-helix transcriptional regulator [Solwaraspora sp. WMMA2080]|uniref:helix-turn-helix domain-containing protein n=1 Tax=unclassified Solwaraspora TaxID=2627926 RepID=UPI00248BEA63|nr:MULTISPECIES: helix-turn-helix transcriptional regulator [unclassified Solwaraspora]WBB99817.1 helix-turn-helix transcriptional regulator [Solwaraspora sp. WMMA2059]WBC21635.1 helix-turn-helix transcriptional regulator [Solwaraspora sp. WMMA2080]